MKMAAGRRGWKPRQALSQASIRSRWRARARHSGCPSWWRFGVLRLVTTRRIHLRRSRCAASVARSSRTLVLKNNPALWIDVDQRIKNLDARFRTISVTHPILILLTMPTCGIFPAVPDINPPADSAFGVKEIVLL